MSVVAQLLANVEASKHAMDAASLSYKSRKDAHDAYVQQLADKLRGLSHGTVVNVDGVQYQVVRTPDDLPYLKLVEVIDL
jgi:hypothetical protein